NNMMHKIFMRFIIIILIIIINLSSFILFNGCSDDVTKLIENLKDENPIVRIRAAESLGEIKDSRAVEPLIFALSDVDLNVQTKAAEALVNIGKPAIKPLIASLNNKNLYIRYQSKFILNQIDPNWRQSKAAKISVLDFITALKDEDPGVRVGSVEALGELKDPRAIESLVKVLMDENSYVLKAAAKALEQIDPSWRESAAAINVVPEFYTALKDRNLDVQQRAEKALTKIGNSDIKILIAKLKQRDPSIRKSAVLELSKKSYELEWLKDTLAVEVLITSLADKDSEIRKSAALVLGKIKASDIVVPLIEALKDTNIEVRNSVQTALKNMGSSAVESLIATLNDANYEIRKTAALVLSEIRGARAFQSLLAELERNNLPVVAGAYAFYIRVGKAGSESILIEALNNYGNSLMAIDFLNCGNGRLAKAAENWAKNNGFMLYAYKVYNAEDMEGPKWGSIRK
ncbi:MAG: HEAT repeat domain-containing protein, partial [bacterium]